MKLRDIFLVNPLTREINPVIKVGDFSQTELCAEIEDYVVTDVLERYLVNFLDHYTETRTKETDKIGVWVSGYVGSGKSHFSKLLGLLASNPSINGRSAVERFRPRVAGCPSAREIEGLLYQSSTFIDTEIIAFQINSVAVKGGADDICSICYRQFFAHRGLSTNFDVAVNIEEPLLEAGRMPKFEEAIEGSCNKKWTEVRQRPQLYWDEIFEAMAEAVSEKWPNGLKAKEDYDRSRGTRQPTFEQLAKDLVSYVSELDKKDPSRKHRLMLILDELGAFVSDSGERLLDVQSLAEELGIHGKGRAWLVVTSHEAMHDIVKNARNFKGDLKKLEGRFDTRFTLTTENIQQVLEERLLKKSTEGEKTLRKRFGGVAGSMADLGILQKADRVLPACEENEFVNSYPFLPYQLILIPDILRNLRVVGGRGEALGGATRSLLGITQGVLRDQRLGYGEDTVGRIVTLDEIFLEMEDQEIPPEARREINSVDARIKDQAFPLRRLLRALFLIQQLNYVPRTLENLARIVATNMEEDISALKDRVLKGLEQLIAAQYVAKTGEQYEYLSGERKRIEEEIAQEDVRTPHKRDALKGFLTADVLEVGPVRYEDTYRFDVRVIADDQVVLARGALEFRMISGLKALLDGIRVDDVETESITTPNTIYWISRPSQQLEKQLDRLVRLDRVVTRYESDTGKSKEMGELVRAKRRDLDESLKPAIEAEIRQSFRNGQIVFRANAHAADFRVERLARVFTSEVNTVIPKVFTLFHKAKILIRDERAAIKDVLTLPPARLHTVLSELKLFGKEGSLNRGSPAVDEVYAYLDSESRRGERITGKALREKYEGIPYGWDPNVPRIIVAALFRAGTLSFSLDKKDFLDPREEESHRILMDSRRFDRIQIALEADRELTVEERMKAREMIQRLFGIRPEETPAALAQTIREQVDERIGILKETAEWVRLTGFPVPKGFQNAAERLSDFKQPRPNKTVRAFLSGLREAMETLAQDEHLKAFYPENPPCDMDLAELIRTVDDLHGFFSDHRRFEFERLKRVMPQLEILSAEPDSPEAPRTLLKEYRVLADDGKVLERWGHINSLLLQALGDLQDTYGRAHKQAAEALSAARDRIVQILKERDVSPEDERAKNILHPFDSHICEKVQNWSPETDYCCGRCRADLRTLLVTRTLCSGWENQAARKIDEMFVPEDGAGKPKARPSTKLDIRKYLPYGRVRSVDEWEKLDSAVRAALKEGKDVSLI